MEVVKIHEFPDLMDQCCDLINNEWPRSKSARMRSLQMSRDNLPTSLVMKQNTHVIGHGKLSRIPTLPDGCFVESVVIHPAFRNRGLGRKFMAEIENYAKSLKLCTVYLSTVDQQGFYTKLGYVECEPVSIYGCGIGYTMKNVFNCMKSQEAPEIPTLRKPIVPEYSVVPKPPPLPPPLPSSPRRTNKFSNTLKKTYMKKDI